MRTVPGDEERRLSVLAVLFLVTPWRLRQMGREGRIHFRRGTYRGFETFFARPSQIIWLPLYRIAEAARIAKVCVRTLQRAYEAGRLIMRVPPGRHQHRITPADLAAYIRQRRANAGTRHLPDLLTLIGQLDMTLRT